MKQKIHISHQWISNSEETDQTSNYLNQLFNTLKPLSLLFMIYGIDISPTAQSNKTKSRLRLIPQRILLWCMTIPSMAILLDITFNNLFKIPLHDSVMPLSLIDILLSSVITYAIIIVRQDKIQTFHYELLRAISSLCPQHRRQPFLRAVRLYVLTVSIVAGFITSVAITVTLMNYYPAKSDRSPRHHAFAPCDSCKLYAFILEISPNIARITVLTSYSLVMPFVFTSFILFLVDLRLMKAYFNLIKISVASYETNATLQQSYVDTILTTFQQLHQEACAFLRKINQCFSYVILVWIFSEFSGVLLMIKYELTVEFNTKITDNYHPSSLSSHNVLPR